MTCTECLSLVATADVGELTAATAVTEHCRTCEECARVIDEVAEEARRLRDALDDVAPGVPPGVVALRAVADAARERRRRATRLRAAAIAGAVLVPLAAVFATRVVPRPAAPVAHASVLLRCMDVHQVAQLTVRELPPDMHSAIFLRVRKEDPIPMISISGPPEMVARTERLIAEVEEKYGPRYSPACAAPDAAGAPRAGPAYEGAAHPSHAAPPHASHPADVYRPGRGR